MDVRGTSKRKVDAWLNDMGDLAGEPSVESTECVSEAMAAEGFGGAGVGAGESSGAKKKKNRRRHKGANPEKWPSKAATKRLHEAALEFMGQYSISQLNATYISKGLQGMDTIKNKFHHMFFTIMSGDEWLEERTKEDFNRWLEEQVQTCVFNLAQVAEKVKGFQRSEVPRTSAMHLLHKMVYWWHDAVRGLSSSNIRAAPWFQQSQNLALGQGASAGVVFLDKGVVVVPLTGLSFRGGNGRVRKVCLQNSKHIPETMELAGKTALHVDNLKKSREKLSIEALVCPCTHPGVIKFFAINDMTMECYSQWWNGGTLGDMFTLDQQNRDPEEIGELAYHATPQTMQEAKRLMAYRRNRTELAWALISIVDAVQQSSVLHNDITPSNVMLHFPNDDGRTVWIGLCDWGMASRINEETHSLYHFKGSSEVRRERAKRWWVAPELMHVIGEPGTSTSPTRALRPPRVSIHTDGYAVGKLAEKIWKKDTLNTDMLPDNTAVAFFRLTLVDLCKSDPLQRRSVTHAVNKLSGPPLFWTPPVNCYREARKEQALLQQQARNED
jgi:hypothetical protein